MLVSFYVVPLPGSITWYKFRSTGVYNVLNAGPLCRVLGGGVFNLSNVYITVGVSFFAKHLRYDFNKRKDTEKFFKSKCLT